MFLVPKILVGSSYPRVAPGIKRAINDFLRGASLEESCGETFDVSATDLLVSLTLRPRTRLDFDVVFGSGFPDVADESDTAHRRLIEPATFRRFCVESIGLPWARWFHFAKGASAAVRDFSVLAPWWESLADHVVHDDADLGKRVCTGITVGVEPDVGRVFGGGLNSWVRLRLGGKRGTWSTAVDASEDLRMVAVNARKELGDRTPFERVFARR